MSNISGISELRSIATKLETIRFELVLAHDCKPNKDCKSNNAFHWNSEFASIIKRLVELAKFEEELSELT